MPKKAAKQKTIPVKQLREETDRLAVQSRKTKQQMDKVQHVADTVVHKAGAVGKKK
jgi:hypothetical protein